MSDEGYRRVVREALRQERQRRAMWTMAVLVVMSALVLAQVNLGGW